jgi:opacity protein-like surface antigen
LNLAQIKIMMIQLSSRHPGNFGGASHRLPGNDWRFLLRKLALVAAVFAFLLFSQFASAQQGDAMFGFNALMSSGSCGANAQGALICPEKGGLYPSFSADVVFHKRVGFNFETAWRASQGSYGGQPFRPIISDFNLLYQPRMNKKVGADLMAGLGWQSTRYYLPFCTGTISCNNFVSSRHFLLHLGGGVRYYVWGNFFVRPEIHYYHIANNTSDFSSDNVFRAGASIGYTIGGPE